MNPAVAQVLGERGLDVTGHVPSLLTPASVQTADVVVTMGCGESCPVSAGTRYEDWDLPDPTGQDLPAVRAIVDRIEVRVRGLLAAPR